MFLAEVLLCPSFFSGLRVLVINDHISVMHPPVVLTLTGRSTLAFAGFSCARNPKGITFLIFKWFPGNTAYTTHTFYINIFWVFHASHFQLMYRRMITLIPGQTGNQSHDPSYGNFFFTPFSNAGVISRLTMHLWWFLVWLFFLTSNNCDDRRHHHTNHHPFFFQWKFYCPYGFWCFVCSW